MINSYIIIFLDKLSSQHVIKMKLYISLYCRILIIYNYIKKVTIIVDIIRRLQFEKTYFVETFEKELFRKRVRKGLISGKRLKRTYSKTNFRRWVRLNNL